MLDPRTGWPTEGTAAVAATAPTAADADAVSTAVFVLGTAGADRITRTRPSVGAVVLSENNPRVDARGSPEVFNLAPTMYTPPSDAD